MTLEELSALFTTRLAEVVSYAPVPRPPATPRHDRTIKHTLYPIEHLPELIAELEKLDDAEGDKKFSVRYLVDEENVLWLAREGKPGRHIPAHRQMRDNCLAAGNIFFSQDFTEITKINHQSGDFHPDAASLLWPLAILNCMKTTLSNPCVIEVSRITPAGNFEREQELSVTPEEMAFILSGSAVLQEKLLVANQGKIPDIIEYVDPARPQRFFPDISTTESLAAAAGEASSIDESLQPRRLF
ncbi:hypothetical protein [Legionella oakridgensis]|uniref:Uncharacterized protein n=2 Tax=Legionella oakridgensis TaxID=29423 RepID=W0BBS7_9GAMM|nr:hypothetical protein [Legionella oakridgensis]AHE66082.1 hypothetical protein Loa_00511 [Legionella oakridgensis ATCC 33761 = DSM 21215]ETO94148.1 hypothetical protein LOR_42c05790 [Legionella oakridgensis RV-2-2007]KTD43834.1 hypothetical protein Loak_0384 [Legionella oakridgensis]STY16001.1 Uncharacterised protein [Legionella longbeachae]